MEIHLHQVGKKFGTSWIFRNIDHSFSSDQPTVILGSNGSGKSTLLKIISGVMLPNEGSIKYVGGEKEIPAEEIYRHVAMVAPYMDLFEKLTLKESLDIHRQFKGFIGGLSNDVVLEMLHLKNKADQVVEGFSSGMKQRLKLGLGILSPVKILLLDEPLTNLDEAGRKWYGEMMNKYGKGRLIVVCSNHVEEEYSFCTQRFEL